MEQDSNIQVGSLIRSLKGRDEGQIYVVYHIVDSQYVELVDGNFRKLANPKLKKVKHLELLPITLDKIKVKLESNMKVFDSEIYSAIKKSLDPNVV